MAGLQRAYRRMDLPADEDLDHSAEPQERFVQDNTPAAHPAPMARPRIGAGSRTSAARHRQSRSVSLWRLLGISSAVLVLGTGGLLALHMIAPGDGGHAVPAEPPRAVSTHAAMATKVASVLGAPAAAPAAVPAAGSAGPTADDFARPAFLEPVTADADDAPDNPPPAASGDAPAATPAGETAPLPTPRPKLVASADTPPAAPAAKDGKPARISMDVTLRAGPKRSASAIATLDEGTRVTLYSCKSWCEVAAGDKRGFVYRNAVAQ